MFLRCKICKVDQPVTTADEADEDPRTRAIRQQFRAEHLVSCGPGAVSLLLYDPLGGYAPPDPECWTHYLASKADHPSDVQVGPDGLFFRLEAGVSRRVCEDCWTTMPPYRDYALGLTSPESDGAGGAVPKRKPTTTDTENPLRASAALTIRRVVCVPCYRRAFARVYPGADLPDLSEDLIDLTPVAEPDPELKPEEWIKPPKPVATVEA